MNKFKQILFRKTNTLPFMLGLFIGMMVMNADIFYNSIVVLLSGSTFHIIRSAFNLPT